MAEIIDEFPVSHHRNSKHPWDTWLDGRVWKIKQGEDCTVETDKFTRSVYAAARNRGLKARIRVLNGDTLVIQARKAARQ